MKTDTQQQSGLWKLEIHPELFSTSNVYDRNGSYVCRISELDEDTPVAEHIVSCINDFNKLEAERDELRKGFEEVADMLMKVKAHLINIDPYFSSPKMVEQIDQILEKHNS